MMLYTLVSLRRQVSDLKIVLMNQGLLDRDANIASDLEAVITRLGKLYARLLNREMDDFQDRAHMIAKVVADKHGYKDPAFYVSCYLTEAHTVVQGYHEFHHIIKHFDPRNIIQGAAS